MNMEKSQPVVIYRCRQCGIEFEREGIHTGNCRVNGVDVPVGPVNVYYITVVVMAYLAWAI